MARNAVFFPLAFLLATLIAFALRQLPTFFVYRMAWWSDVVAWFAGLPTP